MKKNPQAAIAFALVFLAGLSSCSKPVPSSFEEADYAEREVALYWKKGEADKPLTLRFYDSAPHVPYIAVGDYFREFFSTELPLEKQGGRYRYGSGESFLEFDAASDLFIGKRLRDFTSHPDFVDDNAKIFLEEIGTTHTAIKPRTVDLKNYSIDIHEGGGEIYAPLTFLSKLVGGFAGYNVAYNGKDVYVLDTDGRLGDGEKDPSYYGDSYYSVLADFQTERPMDLAAYAYSELCFVFDHLRGYTSQLYFGDNNLISLGLDGLLELYHPDVKAYLLSADKEDYIRGFEALFAGLWDGGHTGSLAMDEDFYCAATQKKTGVKDVDDLIASLGNNILGSSLITYAIQQGRKAAFPELGEESAFYYHSDAASKTAYIGFDQFIVDFEGWDTYYQGKGEIPVSTDSYAFVRDGFLKAKEEGIENIVLDLSSNGGGSTAALLGIVGLLNHGEADFDCNDTFSHFRNRDSYRIDLNLDGKTDEEDAAFAQELSFHVGILTSKASFSCGNLLPSILQEMGYKIMGAQSGGGSCVINIETGADGLPYVRSSYLCLSNREGDNLDSGVPVDFPIAHTYPDMASFDFSGDFSHFFDPSLVGEYLSFVYNQ